MTFLNFINPILPEFTLFVGAALILVIDLYFAKEGKEFFRVSYILSLITCFIALYFCANNALIVGKYYSSMFYSNSFTTLVKFISIALLILVFVLSLNFLEKNYKISAEFIALMMISTVGAMFLISANDFLTLYLGLELQSLPLYLLAAIKRNSRKSSESGMKYFILGSVASGLLLFGISLFYGFSGTTSFDAAFQLYMNNQIPPAVILGFVFILIAMFFKISAAPFHMWTPDVYQGANTVVATFFATVAKFSASLIFVRIFLDVTIGWPGINNVLIFVAIASLLVGSFGAIKQTNMKRLLAYSSIGHIGFVLLGLSALSLAGIKSCVIYMVIYVFLSVGNFGFLTLIEKLKSNNKEDFDEQNEKIFAISSFSGLGKTNPILAAIFAILMFSTAGIPPLAGFFAKFYVLSAAVQSGHVVAATIAVLFSVISAYYYLRIVKIMYFDEAKDSFKFNYRLSAKVVVGAMAAFNLLFILLLKPFVSAISSMVGF
jgi:NADH-quinone oxidoreductase subunit N